MNKKINFINRLRFGGTSIDELCDAIKVESERKDEKIKRLEEKISALEDEKWKDEKLIELQSRIDELEQRKGFFLTKGEFDEAEKFMENYRGGDYGAIGGEFIYTFEPTSIGTICTIIGPDKKEKTLREL